ncbi:MAG: zinc ribbon domain-containing protein, partial [Spirochaetota bacterium]
KIGKSNNQKFVSIPFLKLINQIKYKAELVGINVQTVKENHTSKCDSFALEEIKHQNKYLGKRKKRGLFQSSLNKLVNADVNGAINILRKVIDNSFMDNRYRLSATQPVTVNPL